MLWSIINVTYDYISETFLKKSNVLKEDPKPIHMFEKSNEDSSKLCIINKKDRTLSPLT